MRKKLKPDLDLEAINSSLLDTIVSEYKEAGSLNKTAKNLNLSLMKVRKALITAGVYCSSNSEEVERLKSAGYTIEQMAERMNISPAAVYGYLPYAIRPYKLTDEKGGVVRSVSADAVCRYRDRKKAILRLQGDIEKNRAENGTNKNHNWRGHDGSLWKAITLFAGQKFRTAGRGAKHTGAVGFTYSLKISNRTGEPTDELIISSRPDGKTITRSTVELCLERMLEVQEKEGYVKGPKAAGQIFGASYLYSIFLKWGVIRDKPV